jgi:hypothetical protein
MLLNLILISYRKFSGLICFYARIVNYINSIRLWSFMQVKNAEIVGDFKIQLEKFFDIKIGDIFVCICNPEEFKPFKTNEWSVGAYVSQNRTVFVLEESSSNYSHDEWLKIIKHEMVHIFYSCKFGSDMPKWFNEGLACYLSGQQVQEADFSIGDLLINSRENTKDIYKVGYSAVKILLKGKQNATSKNTNKLTS